MRVEPCLLVSLEPDPDDKSRVLNAMSHLLVNSIFVVDENKDNFSLTFFAKPFAFASCVVWCVTHLNAMKDQDLLRDFTITPINMKHHNNVILKDYGLFNSESTEAGSKCMIS